MFRLTTILSAILITSVLLVAGCESTNGYEDSSSSRSRSNDGGYEGMGPSATEYNIPDNSERTPAKDADQ